VVGKRELSGELEWETIVAGTALGQGRERDGAEKAKAAHEVEAGNLNAAVAFAIERKSNRRLNVGEIDGEEIAFGALNEAAHETALETERGGVKALAIENEAAGFRGDQIVEEGFDEGGEPGFLVAGDGSETGEGRVDLGVELGADLREKDVAEPVAAVVGVAVGGVFAPGEALGCQPLA